MKVLFWGSPAFAVPSLRALEAEGHVVVGVVTQPDRPAGRGRKLRPSAVRAYADEEGYRVLTPERPRGEAFMDEIQSLEPDVSVVVAYGHILVQDVLDLPPQGSINVHASLLPKLRGAAPINWAIIRGEEETGVTVMQMVREMDAGPILHQVREPIGPTETASDLTDRLSEVGAEALVAALAMLEAGLLEPREQDHAQATFAPKISRETARIDWDRDAADVANHIQGMDRVPGAWTRLDGEPVKMFRARAEDSGDAGAPGEVVRADPREGLWVATRLGEVIVPVVQPAGKRRMPATAWINGGGVSVGDVFE